MYVRPHPLVLDDLLEVRPAGNHADGANIMIGLARLKLVLRRFTTLTEFCRDCGRSQPILWTASDELWSEVTGRSDGGGVYCPECFHTRARNRGVILRWLPVVDDRVWRL